MCLSAKPGVRTPSCQSRESYKNLDSGFRRKNKNEPLGSFYEAVNPYHKAKRQVKNFPYLDQINGFYDVSAIRSLKAGEILWRRKDNQVE